MPHDVGMDGDLATSFAEASQYFVRVVSLVPDDRWDEPGLGDWSVRELAAHTNRAHTTVVEYLLHPHAPQREGSTYFSAEQIAARGRAAVAALGDDPLAAVRQASEDALVLVARTSADATIGSPMGAMALAEYLPSRTAELTIHSLDLARALGVDEPAPPAAVATSLVFAAQVAGSAGSGQQVLLALTDRGELPPAYSVYSQLKVRSARPAVVQTAGNDAGPARSDARPTSE